MTVAQAEVTPALFPFFGGKRKVAPEVWDRLGDVSNYVEPFAGSLAVVMGRPSSHEWWRKIETVNDADCFISNFWRANTADPEAVALAASFPVNEADLTARHLYLVNLRAEFTAKLMADPDFYDVKIAGWWLWGICSYMGADWCTGVGGFTGSDEKSFTNGGSVPGVYRKMPMVSGMHPGKGINRLRSGISEGVNESMLSIITAECLRVSDRMRRVRVVCGNWDRVLKQTAMPAAGHITGIFLDPPYDPAERRKDIYAVESDTSAPVHVQVREWALEHGNDPDKRIIYCGYSTEAEDALFEKAGWTVVRWKAGGGYGAAANNRAKSNAARELMWCSPTCVEPCETLPLFS